MTQRTTHAFEPRTAGSVVPVTQRATVPPGPLAWISRLRTSQTAIDPKATLSYIVARSDHDAATLAPAPAVARRVGDDFASGTMLQERYRLMRELGRGGMGIVYLGRDERLDRSVAVKVILPDSSEPSASASMDSRLRASFGEEARLGASLTHPAIATVFDFGFHHDSPFTVFEFIEGETLRELSPTAVRAVDQEGRLELNQAVDESVSPRDTSAGPLENAKGALGFELNAVAWRQATDPDPAKRSAPLAVENALQAVGYEPGNALFIDTLGVARYRTGDYAGAIGDLEKSMNVGGFSAGSTFFLAMARAQLGELDQAKKLYEDAD